MSRLTFLPRRSVAMLALALAACGGGGGGGGAPPPTYSIAGTVRHGSAGLAGVAVSLSGAAASATSTDSSGAYRFSGLASGSYTVTPSLAGGVFTPSSLAVSISGGDANGADFAAAEFATLATGLTLLPAATVSTDQPRASLLVRGGNVYFSDASDAPLKEVPAGGGPVTALAARIGMPESVAVRGGYAYWVDGNRLNRSALDGSATVLLATGSRDPASGPTADLVVDDTAVYWVNNSASSVCDPSCDYDILRLPLAGGAAVKLAHANRKVVALAGDADHLYWEEASLEPVAVGCQCGSAIKSVPKIGGAIVLLVDSLLNGPPPNLGPGYTPGSWMPAGGLAVDASRVVFGISGAYGIVGYQVSSVPLAGGPVSALGSLATSGVDALNVIRTLKLDASNAYWIDSDHQTLATVPLAGGGVTTLAAGLLLPDYAHAGSVAIANGRIYWTEAGSYAGCCLKLGSGRLRSLPLGGGAVATVADALDMPLALDVDSASGAVVVAESWRVAKLPAAGAAAVTLASGITTSLARLAADQAYVYVLDGDLIKRLPLAGGQLEKLAAVRGTVGDSSLINDDIATDGQDVVWTLHENVSAPAVFKVALAGGPVVQLVSEQQLPAGPQDCYRRVALDASYAYWSSSLTQNVVGCSVRRVPRAGGRPETVVDVASLLDFGVDATDLYYSDLPAGVAAIHRLPLAGGTATTVASAVAAPLEVAAQTLYWVDPLHGTLNALAKNAAAGSTPANLLPVPIVTDPRLAYEGLATDAAGVYCTSTGSGSLYSVR